MVLLNASRLKNPTVFTDLKKRDCVSFIRKRPEKVNHNVQTSSHKREVNFEITDWNRVWK